jgi:hypothetical protein
LTIVTSGNVAVASMLIRASGTRKNGHEVGFWVRATSSFQRSDDGVADYARTRLTARRPCEGECGHEPGALDRHRGPFDVRCQHLRGVPRRPSPASGAAHVAPRVRRGSAGLISRGFWRHSR